jgi:hypothetical protein
MAKKASSSSRNPKEVQDRIAAILKGVVAKLIGAPPLDVTGTPYTSDQLTTALNGAAAPYTTADEAHEAATAAVHARNQEEPATLALLDAIEIAIKARFGEDNVEIEAFGLTPRKPRRKPTPAERVATQEKTDATREADGESKKTPPPAPAAGSTSAAH